MEVFYSSPWIPVEWIQAHGFEPRGVWWNTTLQAGQVSEGVCPFAHAVLHRIAMQPSAVAVLATTCDQMRRAFDTLISRGHDRIFLFNIPATWQSHAARNIYRGEVERLGRFLQRLGGQAPSQEALTEIMIGFGQSRQMLLEAAPRCCGRAFAEALCRFHWDGQVILPQQGQPEPQPGVALALVGGPWSASAWPVLDLIERAGGRIALHAAEPGERNLWLAPAGEDLSSDPFSSLVETYWEHTVDVFQRPNRPLYGWLRQALAVRQVQGIILWHPVGCDLWRAEIQSMREAFGLPVLPCESNGYPGCSHRDQSRLEAFIELLQ